MKKSLPGIIGALLLAAACSGPAPDEFTTKDAGAIRQQTDTFGAAINAKDVPKILGLYAENSVFMPPNEPIIRGTEALKHFYDDLIRRGASNLKLDITEVSGHGPIAYESGTYEMDTKVAAGSGGHDRGKYLFVLRKLGTTWKYEYMIWNSDFPPEGH
jgi:ketosteroid isomerase-like protein